MIMSLDSDPSTLQTRLSLLARLHNWEDSKSWDEFYRLYRKLVYGFARRSGLTHEEAEEVTQDVFTRVAKTIQNFEADPEKGSFRGWLMTLTRWRVTDKFRDRTQVRRPSEKRESEDRTSTIERIPDPVRESEIWDQEWQTILLEAAMERLAHRTQAKHFQIFELYTRKQWPIRRVSSELGVNAASIYLISHRLTKQLKAEVAKLEATLDRPAHR
jgi:RNA polymerase sigma factor (sigma-70 family)